MQNDILLDMDEEISRNISVLQDEDFARISQNIVFKAMTLNQSGNLQLIPHISFMLKELAESQGIDFETIVDTYEETEEEI